MLTRRHLGMTATVLAVCLLAMNCGIAYLTRNSVPRRVLRHALNSRTARVLALGNSLMVAGFDESAFDSSAGLKTPEGAVNLGLGGSSPVEQLLLFRFGLAPG